MVGSQDWLAGNEAVTECSVREGGRRCVSTQDGWSTTLITLHASDLPASQNFAGNAVIQILFTGPGRQFVDVTENQHVGRVLKTGGFLRFGVKRVLGRELA